MSYDLENQSIKIEVRLLAVQYPIVFFFVMGASRMIQALVKVICILASALSDI